MRAKFLALAGLTLLVAGGAAVAYATTGRADVAPEPVEAGCCVTGDCCCPGQGACCDPAKRVTGEAAKQFVKSESCCATGNCCCPGAGSCCAASPADCCAEKKSCCDK